MKRLAAILISMVLLSATVLYVQAQTSDDTWAAQSNLSNSGSTTDPRVVVDSDGIIHVVWLDYYAGRDDTPGFFHSFLEEDSWSEPVVVNFPLAISTPQLVPDLFGNLHAFWIDENGALNYGLVVFGGQGSGLGLASYERIAESALNFDVMVDPQDGIHLVYIRPLDEIEFPAGVYYQRSNNRGDSWSQASILYQSKYFRGLTEDDTNVSITSADGDEDIRLTVTYDDLLRKRVFLSRSDDGGSNWHQAQEVDGPDSSDSFVGPFGIKPAATGQETLVIWQTGNPEGSCTHLYQSSSNGGLTWSEPKQMLEHISGCSQSNQFFYGENEGVILETTINDQSYLMAWDGSQWSDPQLQQDLSSFEDPETFEYIYLGCHHFASVPQEERLIFVGCEKSGNGDIWSTNRLLGGVSDWFPEQAAWSDSTIVASNIGKMVSPVMVSDSQGNLHAFWIQVDGLSELDKQTMLNYARWDDKQWLPPLELVDSIGGNSSQPAVVIDMKDNLFLTWSNDLSGEIMFSRANAGTIFTRREWVQPQTLPSPSLWARSPSIYVDESGAISVAYVVPLNDERGVYITRSTDKGETWSEPVQVFDAVAAGWEMVEQPSMSANSDGHLHISWTRLSSPGGIGPLNLSYADSLDGGQSWSEAATLTEGPIVWSKVIGSGESIVHQLWQDYSSGHFVINHQVSYDGGATWSTPTSISSFGKAQGQPGVALDQAGHLHLAQAYNESDDKLAIRYWLWDGDRWLAGESLEIDNNIILAVHTISADVSPSGIFSVIGAGTTSREQDDELEEIIFYNESREKVPNIQPAQTPSPTELPFATETDVPIATPMPELTPEQTIEPVSPTPVERNPDTSTTAPPNVWRGLVLGGGLVLLFIGLAFIIRLIRVRRG